MADTFYNIYDIDEILFLQNVGLVNLDNALHPKSHNLNNSKNTAFICNGFALSINCNQQINAHRITGAVISDTGGEIINITDNISEPTIDEINQVGDYVWKNLPSDISFDKMNAYLTCKNGKQILFGTQVGKTWIKE